MGATPKKPRAIEFLRITNMTIEPKPEDKIKALLDLSEKIDSGVVEIHNEIQEIRAMLILLLKDFDDSVLRYAVERLTKICLEKGIRIPIGIKRKIGY